MPESRSITRPSPAVFAHNTQTRILNTPGTRPHSPPESAPGVVMTRQPVQYQGSQKGTVMGKSLPVQHQSPPLRQTAGTPRPARPAPAPAPAPVASLSAEQASLCLHLVADFARELRESGLPQAAMILADSTLEVLAQIAPALPKVAAPAAVPSQAAAPAAVAPVAAPTA
jgi:hypothetical protein